MTLILSGNESLHQTRHETLTDPEHVEAAARLRTAFQTPAAAPAQIDVMVRDLADYDAAFGVQIDVGVDVGVQIEVAS